MYYGQSDTRWFRDHPRKPQQSHRNSYPTGSILPGKGPRVCECELDITEVSQNHDPTSHPILSSTDHFVALCILST